MDAQWQSERARGFRDLGYVGFAVLGLVLSLERASPEGLLLATAALLWLLIARLAPRWGLAESALCQVDCLLVPLAGALVEVEFWSGVILTGALLTGVAAHGGPRLLLKGGLLAAATWALCGGLHPPGAIPGAPATRGATTAGSAWQAGVSVGLLYAFSLGIALVSYRQAQRLRARRASAVRESESLKDANSRLIRYLPASVGRLLLSTPTIPQTPVHRWVTVAFIDVVGFTALVAERPLAEVSDVVNDYLACLADLVADRGGELGKFLGDGVLVYFQENSGRELERGRDAARCARLCVDANRALIALAERWNQRGLLVSLHTRTGIASGSCAVGDWGGGGRLDFTLIGSVVNLASRLQAEAAPGCILLSENAALLICQDPALAGRVEPQPARILRGLGLCRLFCLVDETPPSAKVPTTSDHPGRADNP